MSDYIEQVLNDVREKNVHEPEYLQAVEEVLHTIKPPLLQTPTEADIL